MNFPQLFMQSGINNPIGPINIVQPYGFTSLGEAVNTLVSTIYFLAALAALFYLFLGALKYIMAGSDDKKLEGARATMIHAIVGLMLMGLVMVLFQVLGSAIPGFSQMFSL